MLIKLVFDTFLSGESYNHKALLFSTDSLAASQLEIAELLADCVVVVVE